MYNLIYLLDTITKINVNSNIEIEGTYYQNCLNNLLELKLKYNNFLNENILNRYTSSTCYITELFCFLFCLSPLITFN